MTHTQEQPTPLLDQFCERVRNAPGGTECEWLNYDELYEEFPPYVDQEKFKEHMLEDIRDKIINVIAHGETELDKMAMTDFILGHLLVAPIEGYSGLHSNLYYDVSPIPIPEDVQEEVRFKVLGEKAIVKFIETYLLGPLPEPKSSKSKSKSKPKPKSESKPAESKPEPKPESKPDKPKPKRKVRPKQVKPKQLEVSTYNQFSAKDLRKFANELNLQCFQYGKC